MDRLQIAEGLRSLGVQPGSILFVHSSLSSLGHVDGGAEAVIAALLEVLGPEGTLMMPTHTARTEQVFIPETTPSAMGLITEVFRQRPGVLRSRHPYHPVAAFGPRAAAMLRDHELSAVPDGPDTPYARLISQGGWVLHIGCDLDTLTLLHAVEAELDLPYLRELDQQYLDATGTVRSLHLVRCPGGHRGGVLKFDRLFRAEGAMHVGRIGRAQCRLLSAARAAAIMRRELTRDPTFALDDNPNCADCTRYRGKIQAARLAHEDFRLSAPLWAVSESLDEALALIQGEGIAWVELQAAGLPARPALLDLRERLAGRGCRVASLRCDLDQLRTVTDLVATASLLDAEYVHLRLPGQAEAGPSELVAELRRLAGQVSTCGMGLLLANRPQSHSAAPAELAALVAEVGLPGVYASYDPASIALSGVSPFYGGLYRGPLRGLLRHADLRDVVAATGEPAALGMGNAEIREIISSLRCHTFDGFLCLWPLPDQGADGFRAAARAFWGILESI